MSLLWPSFSGLLPVEVVDLGDSGVFLEMSGCSLVTVISRAFGNDDMVSVL